MVALAAVLVALTVSSPAVAAAAAPPAIEHDGLACLPADENPLVEARVRSEAGIGRVRAYFKAAGEEAWYYVDMKADQAPAYRALLPVPLPETRAVDYYVEALDSRMATSRTAEFSARVAKETCPRPAAAWAGAKELFLGATKANQPLVPPGFSPTGIAELAGVNGQVVTAGGQAGTGAAGTGAAAAGAGAAGAAAGAGLFGLSTGAVLAAGGALAATTVVVAAAGGGSDAPDPLATDDDGDGYSENQGDCNDGNGAVKPGGAVTATLTDTRAGRTIVCTDTYERRITVTNSSCQPVTVTGIAYVSQAVGHSGSTTCSSISGVATPAVSSVAPGATATVFGYVASYACCVAIPGGMQGGGDWCRFQWTDTVQTSAGNFVAGTIEYTLSFSGYIPACPSSSSQTLATCPWGPVLD